MSSSSLNAPLITNKNYIDFKISNFPLVKGLYYISTYIEIDNVVADWLKSAVSFEVMESKNCFSNQSIPSGHGVVNFNYVVTT